MVDETSSTQTCEWVTDEGCDGNDTVQNNWTGGINFRPKPNMRLQLNYTAKQTSNEFELDLDDDILLLNFQFFFNSRFDR